MPATDAPSFSISQLARETRLPIARIKFYLREGLLPAGDLRAQKRAFYNLGHVQRLKLIHVLRQVAGLPVPAIRALCTRIDQGAGGDLSAIISGVIDALGGRPPREPAFVPREVARARRELLAMLSARGVRVRPDARAVSDLAGALLGLREVMGPELSAQAFAPYLDAMCRLAEQDFAASAHLLEDAANAGLLAALGTVLWEPVLVLLRRIAHEHVAAQRLGGARRAPRRRAR